jgi:signal peptidase II
MQTTRGTSLSDEGDKRGTSAEPSATGQLSDEGDKRGTSAEPSATGESHVANGRRRHLGVLFGVAVFVIAADLISKIIVVAKLSDRAPLKLLGGLLTLEETRNPGAAFSIGTGATFLFGIVAIAVIVVILRTARRLFSRPWSIVLGLLLGGATGNLIDRLVRSPGVLRGHVVDWIRLPHFAVFNLADSSITIGGVLAVLLALSGRQLDGSVARPSGKAEAVVPPAPDERTETNS